MDSRIRPFASPSSRRWLCAAAIAAWLVAVSPAAQAATQSQYTSTPARFGEAAFDVGILRPLSTAALVLGSVFFVVSAPFVAPSSLAREGCEWKDCLVDGARPAFDTFIFAPYEYVVLREIGDF